jgi:uncharacterized membrane protein
MQFSHETSVTVDACAREVWEHWLDIHRLPRYLSHVRATAPSDGDDDLARLVIILDGRHIEFAAQRTMCSDDTLCWQSLGPTFLYLLTVSLTPTHGGTQVTVTVAYDPPGFLPDIAESLGLSRSFRRTFETDLRRYAKSLQRREMPAFALAD